MSRQKFINNYRKYFNSNQLHLLFEVIDDPSVSASLAKNRMPQQKTVLAIIKSKGIDVDAIDEEDLFELDGGGGGGGRQPSKSIRTSVPAKFSGGGGGGSTTGSAAAATFPKELYTVILRIESKVNAVEDMLKRNLDIALPSDIVQTDLQCDPEKRRAFTRRRKNQNELMYKYDELYTDFVKEWKSGDDEYHMVKELFYKTLFMIDMYVNNSFFINFSKTGGSDIVVNPKITIVVFDRDADFSMQNSEHLLSADIMKRVFHTEEKSKKYCVRKDPIVFMSMKVPFAEEGGQKFAFSIIFYIDLKLLLNQYNRSSSSDAAFERDHIEDCIPATTNAEIISPLVWDSKKFSEYFLDQVKDAYVHLVCALCAKNPCTSHDGVFKDYYTSFFG